MNSNRLFENLMLVTGLFMQGWQHIYIEINVTMINTVIDGSIRKD